MVSAVNEYMDEVDRVVASLDPDIIKAKGINLNALEDFLQKNNRLEKESQFVNIDKGEDVFSDEFINRFIAAGRQSVQNLEMLVNNLNVPKHASSVMRELVKERSALQKKEEDNLFSLKTAKESLGDAEKSKDRKKIIKAIQILKRINEVKNADSAIYMYTLNKSLTILSSPLLRHINKVDFIEKNSLSKVKGLSNDVDVSPFRRSYKLTRSLVLVFSSICDLVKVQKMYVGDDDRKTMVALLKSLQTDKNDSFYLPVSKESEKYFFSRVDDITKRYFQKSKITVDEIGSTELEFVSALYRNLSAMKNSLASMLAYVKISPIVYNLGKQAHVITENILSNPIDIVANKRGSSLDRQHNYLQSLETIGFQLRYIIKVIGIFKEVCNDEANKANPKL